MKRTFLLALLLSSLCLFLSPVWGQDNGGDYLIQAGDVLRVTVLGEEDLHRECRVSAHGSITYPLLGEVSVMGLTSPQVEQALTKRLNEYLVDPQVSVFITQFGRIYVMGQVAKPGAFEYHKSITVLESITLAGGLTPVANPRKIKVIRKLEGEETSLMVDLKAIMDENKQENDVRLFPGDIVFVPESFL